jgi:hypothetical protein
MGVDGWIDHRRIALAAEAQRGIVDLASGDPVELRPFVGARLRTGDDR